MFLGGETVCSCVSPLCNCGDCQGDGDGLGVGQLRSGGGDGSYSSTWSIYSLLVIAILEK